MAKSNGKDRRELCAAATEEPDSEKLVSLINEILEAFDQRDQGGALSRHSKPFVAPAVISAE